MLEARMWKTIMPTTVAFSALLSMPPLSDSNMQALRAANRGKAVDLDVNTCRRWKLQVRTRLR
jgi:hypothetical protein